MSAEVAFQNDAQRWHPPTLRHRFRQALLVLRLVPHGTIGRWLLADGAARWQRAWREWESRRGLDPLTLRSEFEGHILSAMTEHDEYGLMERRLHRDDTIVDVGAHIGGFSYLCHRHGSRAIHAFEPDPGNFELLRLNLAGLPGAHLDHRAVFRSDAVEGSLDLQCSGYDGENTGTVSVIWSGTEGEVESRVEAVALDDVLSRLGKVKLLKLDCEGSEFPILLTSRQLGRVEEIVGEYHEVYAPEMAHLAPAARVQGVESYRRKELVAVLEQAGFVVTLRSGAENLGLFRAIRP